MSDWQRDEILKLRKEVERLSGKTGFCLQCEKYAKQAERYREALERISVVSQFGRPEGQIVMSEHYEACWLDCVGIAKEALSGREGRG